MFTEEIKTLAYQMYLRGENDFKVAAYTGVSVYTVESWKRKYRWRERKKEWNKQIGGTEKTYVSRAREMPKRTREKGYRSPARDQGGGGVPPPPPKKDLREEKEPKPPVRNGFKAEWDDHLDTWVISHE